VPTTASSPAVADTPRRAPSIARKAATTTAVIFTLGAGALTSVTPAMASVPTCVPSSVSHLRGPCVRQPQPGAYRTMLQTRRMPPSAKRYGQQRFIMKLYPSSASRRYPPPIYRRLEPRMYYSGPFLHVSS
jgi:hypothetical protein